MFTPSTQPQPQPLQQFSQPPSYLLKREQHLQLLFSQIDMIEDIEALEDISERVLHRIQILKSLQPQFHTKRPLPNSSTISTAPLTSPFSPQSKLDFKRADHLRRQQSMHLQSNRDTPFSDNPQIPSSVSFLQPQSINQISTIALAPNYNFHSFDWVYNPRFQKHGLTLKPSVLAQFNDLANLFTIPERPTNSKQSKPAFVSGEHVHALIQRYFNDVKKPDDRAILDDPSLSQSQAQWIHTIVSGVREYCRDYLKLNEYTRSSQQKIDAIFYNDTHAVLIDWKFSAFSAIEQILMNESTAFIDAIAEAKKLFNHQKHVSLLIVPLKRTTVPEPTGIASPLEENNNNNLLIELTSDDVESLQREQIHTEIFYMTKYKKMRNNLLARAWNVHQKCALGEGRKNHMSIREYLVDIVHRQKPNQIEYYGNYKNCYAIKNPPTNKDQFWALHVLLKEIAAKNARIIAIIDTPQIPATNHLKKNKQCTFNFYGNQNAINAGTAASPALDIDFISMTPHDSLPPLKRFHSANNSSGNYSDKSIKETQSTVVAATATLSSTSEFTNSSSSNTGLQIPAIFQMLNNKEAKVESKSVFQYIMDKISGSGQSPSQSQVEEEDDEDDDEDDENYNDKRGENEDTGKKVFNDSQVNLNSTADPQSEGTKILEDIQKEPIYSIQSKDCQE